MDAKVLSSSDLEKTGSLIWERLFLTSMCYKDTLSVEHIRLFGMPTVGDTTIDNDIHNQVVDRYLTINQMVDYFKKGIQVSIKIHPETEDIYNIISAYLFAWKRYLDNGINIGGAPIEDLIALDRFASSVYDHAVEHITEDYIQSSMLRYVSNNKLSRSTFEKKQVIHEGTGEVKRRESLAESFSNKIYSAKTRLWR